MKIETTDKYETSLSAEIESDKVKLVVAQTDTGGMIFLDVEQLDFISDSLKKMSNKIKKEQI